MLIPVLTYLIISAFSNTRNHDIDVNKSTTDTALKEYAAGDYFFKNEDYATAILNYERAASLGHKSSLLFLKHGLAEVRNKNADTNSFKKAIFLFSKSLAIKPNNQKYSDYIVEEKLYVMNEDTDYFVLSSYLTLEYKYLSAYFHRSVAKFELRDFYGAIQDIKTFHKLDRDSSFSSCYILAESLLRTNQNKLATHYFNYLITNKSKLETDILSSSYLFRGYANLKSGKKQQACLDFSKASELGNEMAFEAIKKHCQ